MTSHLSATTHNITQLLTTHRPTTAIITGSGLSHLTSRLDNPKAATYTELGLPTPTTPGHNGTLTTGTWGPDGPPVAIAAGRIHLYNGYSAAQTCETVHTLAAAGITTFIVTNAAGTTHHTWNLGELALITDHINLTGTNPYLPTAANPALPLPPHARDPHTPMANAYTPELLTAAENAAAATTLHHGVYAAVPGPTYETAAEIRAYKTLGADLIGMSTVNETIVAATWGARVLALSAITNHATGITTNPHTHTSVLEHAAAAETHLGALLSELLPAIT